MVRPDRDGSIHRHPARRPRAHLAQGRPRMGLEELAESLGKNILTTTMGTLVGWGRANSVCPSHSALAGCAIEIISPPPAGVSIAPFGSAAFRPSPPQSH